MSAEACRAKQSISGFSRNIQDPSEAIDQRPQHKRKQKLVKRSTRSAASAETVELHPKQLTSASAQACFSTSVSRSLSSEAIDKRLQQKQSSFIRSNRASASAQACFSTNVIRSLSSETIEYRLQQKQSSFIRSNRAAASVQACFSTSASRSLSSEATDKRPQQQLVE